MICIICEKKRDSSRSWHSLPSKIHRGDSSIKESVEELFNVVVPIPATKYVCRECYRSLSSCTLASRSFEKKKRSLLARSTGCAFVNQLQLLDQGQQHVPGHAELAPPMDKAGTGRRRRSSSSRSNIMDGSSEVVIKQENLLDFDYEEAVGVAEDFLFATTTTTTDNNNGNTFVVQGQEELGPSSSTALTPVETAAIIKTECDDYDVFEGDQLDNNAQPQLGSSKKTNGVPPESRVKTENIVKQVQLPQVLTSGKDVDAVSLSMSCPHCLKTFTDMASRGRHIRLNHRNAQLEGTSSGSSLTPPAAQAGQPPAPPARENFHVKEESQHHHQQKNQAPAVAVPVIAIMVPMTMDTGQDQIQAEPQSQSTGMDMDKEGGKTQVHSGGEKKLKSKRTPGGEKIWCPDCPKAFARPWTLIRHLKNIHGKSNPFSVPPAPAPPPPSRKIAPPKKLSARRLAILLSREKSRAMYPFTCPSPSCERKFKRESELRAHSVVHSKEFSSLPSFQQFLSQYDGVRRPPVSSAAAPFTSNSSKYRYRCEYCQRVFHKNKGRKEHLAKAHPGEKDLFYSARSVPNKINRPPPSLSPSSNIKSPPPTKTKKGSVSDLTCPICARTFFSIKTLFRHQLTLHLFNGPAQLEMSEEQESQWPPTTTCSACNMAFPSRFHLKLHEQRIHLQRDLHKCTACSRTFSHKCFLQVHVSRVHKFKRAQEASKRAQALKKQRKQPYQCQQSEDLKVLGRIQSFNYLM